MKKKSKQRKERRTLLDKIYGGQVIQGSVLQKLNQDFEETGKMPKWARRGMTEELGEIMSFLLYECTPGSGVNSITEKIWQHCASIYMNNPKDRASMAELKRKKAKAKADREKRKRALAEARLEGPKITMGQL
jgi:hypothetical protein